jgi:tRNA A37 N6-isopentenylltransferase MiaA
MQAPTAATLTAPAARHMDKQQSSAGEARTAEAQDEPVAWLQWACAPEQQQMQNAISARCSDEIVRGLVVHMARSAWLAGIAFGKAEGQKP